jgi:hypothetical protein
MYRKCCIRLNRDVNVEEMALQRIERLDRVDAGGVKDKVYNTHGFVHAAGYGSGGDIWTWQEAE